MTAAHSGPAGAATYPTSSLVSRWRFALTRRWFAYLGLAVVFAVACGFLSNWQFGRNAQTLAANNLLQQNYDAKAVSVDSILPTPAYYSPAIQWRQVNMVGHYLPSKQLLVRDRSLGANPGFEVLTPFEQTNGSIFIVDRGWVPVGTKVSTAVPDFIPPAPTSLEHVTAHLEQSEPVLAGRIAPKGQISEINLATVVRLDHLTATTYTGAYGTLAKETPTPPSRPTAAMKPTIDNGPFLSYAIQWILFGLMGFFGLGLGLRAEYRTRNADDPLVRARAEARDAKARLRAPTEEQIEDQQIAAEAAQRAAEAERARELADAG